MSTALMSIPEKYRDIIPTVVNGILFQAGWWVCMLASTPIILTFVVFYLVLHIKLHWLTQTQWVNVARITVLGWALDSILSFSGLLNFANGQQVLPIWLLSVWAMFAVTIFLSLKFLNRHLLLAAGLGLIGAGLSYFGGDKIRDDIAIGLPEWPVWQGALIIGVIWSVFLPFVYYYLRFQKVEPFVSKKGKYNNV